MPPPRSPRHALATTSTLTTADFTDSTSGASEGSAWAARVSGCRFPGSGWTGAGCWARATVANTNTAATTVLRTSRVSLSHIHSKLKRDRDPQAKALTRYPGRTVHRPASSRGSRWGPPACVLSGRQTDSHRGPPEGPLTAAGTPGSRSPGRCCSAPRSRDSQVSSIFPPRSWSCRRRKRRTCSFVRRTAYSTMVPVFMMKAQSEDWASSSSRAAWLRARRCSALSLGEVPGQPHHLPGAVVQVPVDPVVGARPATCWRSPRAPRGQRRRGDLVLAGARADHPRA